MRWRFCKDKMKTVELMQPMPPTQPMPANKNTPTISVVIVNWNSGALLNQCIAQLEKQTVTPAQIFVVDNASADDSTDLVKQSDKVIYCGMTENLGFAKGNNWAIAQCTSDYVALLNPDAFAEPDWIEQLLKAALQYPDVDVFGSRQLDQREPTKLDGIGDVYHISGLPWREGFGKLQQPEDLVAREIFTPCAAASMYSRKALNVVGGFDEDYFCYLEDVDLGFRLRLAGYSARYVPEAVVHHVGSATSGGMHSDFAVYHGHRNIVWTFVKDVPGLLFWLLLPAHLMLNLVIVVAFVQRGKGKVILRAKRDALLGIPKMLRKRREIQRTRTVSISAIWSRLDKSLIKR